MAITFGAQPGSDAPLLIQQGGQGSPSSGLAQLLAQQAQMAAPRTAQAAQMQGLAQLLAGLGNGVMQGRDRGQQEEASDVIAAALQGKAPPEAKPGLLQRAANFVGLGDEKPAATGGPTESAPRTRQLASLIAEGNQPDQTPAVGGPMGAPAPARGGSPAAPAPGVPTTATANPREALAKLLSSDNKYVRAWAQNLAMSELDAETKRNAEVDLAYAKDGLRRMPDGSVVDINGFGPSKGRIKGAEFEAQTPSHLARRQNEADQDLQNKPKLAAETIRAETGPKVDQERALTPVLAGRAGATQLATDSAALTNAERLADARSAGTTAGAARASLAPAPAAPGVTPGATIEQALSEAKAKGTQIAQGPGQSIEKEAGMRGQFNGISQVQNHRETVQQYQGIVEASKRDSKAADLNMVYGIAKIFDPGSVVREGEQILVNKTASLPDQVVGWINSINGGARLTPDTRTSMVREAQGRVQASRGVYDQLKGEYERIAKDSGLNPRNVIVDVATPAFPVEPPKPTVQTVKDPPPLAVPQQRGAQPPPQFTPDQVQAEIARRRGLKAN